MKQVTKTLGIVCLCTLLGVSSPAVAQTTDNTSTTEARTSGDNDGDSGKIGLAGLLGLLGLLGLKRRDDDKHKTNLNR
jgi:MYXO-CTERM domain-containing protein